MTKEQLIEELMKARIRETRLKKVTWWKELVQRRSMFLSAKRVSWKISIARVSLAECQLQVQESRNTMQGLSKSSFVRIKCHRTYAMCCQRYDSLLCKRNLLRINHLHGFMEQWNLKPDISAGWKVSSNWRSNIRSFPQSSILIKVPFIHQKPLMNCYLHTTLSDPCPEPEPLQIMEQWRRLMGG